MARQSQPPGGPVLAAASPHLAAWQRDAAFRLLHGKAKRLAAAPPPRVAEFLTSARDHSAPPLSAPARAFAEQVRGKPLGWLGMGGASLGALVLAALRPAPTAGGAPICFADGLDEAGLTALLSQGQAPRHFVVVSQSGETAETLVQLNYVLAELAHKGCAPRTHLLGVAGPGAHALRRVAAAADFPLLQHAGAAGRFSIASALGAWSAHWLGLEADALRRGLAAGCARTEEAALGAAQLVHAMQQGLNMQLVLAFAPPFEILLRWYRQLWSESLGKAGHGSTPLPAFAPGDLHSQWQLYLAGPNDKFVTLLCRPRPESGRFSRAPSRLPAGPAWLADLSYQALLHSQQKVAEQELCEAGRVLRRWTIPWRLDAVAEWMGYKMLETCLSACLLRLDPFTQPAVDSGKRRMRQFWQAQNRSKRAETRDI